MAIKGAGGIIYGAQLNTSLIVYQFERINTISDLFTQTLGFLRSLKQSNVNYSYYPITNLAAGHEGLLNTWFSQTHIRNVSFMFNGITKTEILTEFYIDLVNKNMLLFEQEQANNRLNFRVRFDKRFINRELLENFIASYRKLFLEVLDDLVYGNNKQISSYNLLDDKQYQQIVYEFDRTERAFPQDNTIHQMVEEQMIRTANNVAVLFEGQKITYNELNARSIQLAYYLREQYTQLNNEEFKPNTLIILYLEGSIEMVVAILAVLKAGGGYVPIEPGYPQERIGFILEDEKSSIVITQEHLRIQLDSIIQERKHKKENEQIRLVIIDNEKTTRELKLLSTVNLKPISKPTDFAYIIYASGTTGNPKGIMLEHRGVINTVLFLYDIYDFNYGNRNVAFTSYMFDASVAEFFITLFRVAELHVLSARVKKDAFLISDYIKQHGINYIYLPPAMLAVFPSLNIS